MAASVQCRQHERNFGTIMENRKDDDLALFHELENRSMEKNEFLLHESNDFGDQLGIAPKQNRSLLFKTAITVPPRRTGVDAFLNSENDKTDYDWLLTPPDTPLFPSIEMEKNGNVVNQFATSNGHTTAPELKHAKPQTQPVTKNYEAFKPLIPSASSNRRPQTSAGPTSRPATPTSRAALPMTKKPISRPSTPTLRPTLPATTKPARSSTPTPRPTLPSSTKPTRPSTPTSRATIPSTTKPNRPSTPTSRASRPSTPTPQASIPSTTKPNKTSTPTSRASRPSTPTSRASIPATAKPNRPSTPTSRPTLRSSTPTNTSSGPKVVKNSGSSRGSSPTMKSRPLKDAPNLKATLPSARSSSTGRTRQPSNGFSVLAMSRGHSMNGDEVNPGLMGTKMVERVVNMRKLVPPKQDENGSSNSSGKTMSSQENLGRTLSKTSLDMAIRHMDITKRISGNLRPLVTNIPASSVYSVRSGPTKGKSISSSDSPIGTSSTASSDPSVNYRYTCLDSIELEDNKFQNNREKSSPATA